MAEERRFGKFRSWRQKFKPGAEFVFRRRVCIGHKVVDCQNVKIYVEAGSTLDKTFWRPRQIRALWRSQAIELKDWTPPPIVSRKVGAQLATPIGKTAAEVGQPAVEFLGCGWYAVTHGGKTRKVQIPLDASPDVDMVELAAKQGDEPVVTELGGSWYQVDHGGREYKVQGRSDLEKLLAKLRE